MNELYLKRGHRYKRYKKKKKHESANIVANKIKE